MSRFLGASDLKQQGDTHGFGTFTVEEKPRKHTSVILWARLLTLGSSVAEGYAMGSFGGVAVLVQEDLQLSTTATGAVTAAGHLAMPLGAVAGGFIADRCGRRACLILSYLVLVVGLLMMAFSGSYLPLFLGRVLEGLSIGAGLAAVAVYMCEISPSHMRGMMATLEETFIVSGLMLGYALNVAFFGMEHDWRLMLITGAAIPVILIIFILAGFLPESPRFLAMSDQKLQAKAVLEMVVSKEEVEMTMNDWEAEAMSMQKSSYWALFWALLCEKTPRAYTLIASVGVLIMQNTSGIVLIGIYLPQLLSPAMTAEHALHCAVLIGVGRFFSALSANFLVDQIGRVSLLKISSFGVLLGQGLLFISYRWGFEEVPWKLLAFGIYSVAYEVGLGPVPWVYSSEVLDTGLRSKGMSLGMFVGRLYAGVLLLSFQPIADAIGLSNCWLCLMIINILAIIFLYSCVPESKGNTLETMHKIFN